MSVRARRKNLRQYELSSGDLQGSPELLVRAAQVEALAPSSPTIGVIQDAIVLLVFKIPATAPNVPEMLPVAIDAGSPTEESKKARRFEKSGKFRVACHAIIHSPETSDVSDAQLEHSSHCMPNPLDIPNITAEQYYFWSKKYPIYVGDFIEDNSEEVGGQGRITRGSAIRVRDNDVQGGVYGNIMEVLNTPFEMPTFGSGPINGMFSDGSEPINANGGDQSEQPNSFIDPLEYVYEGSNFRWFELYPSATANSRGLNNSPETQQAVDNLRIFTEDILDPLRDAGIGFTINSGYRTEEVNQAVAGAAHSQHKTGLAFDLRFINADKSNRAAQVELFEITIPEIIGNWQQLIIYEDTNHIHIGYGTKGEYLVHTVSPKKYVKWATYDGALAAYKTTGASSAV